MADMDKTTVKTPAFSGKTGNIAPQNNLTEEQNNALELVKKNALLEEEKKKSLEYQKTIEQLRECIKQEQAKMAEMANKVARLEAKAIESVELEAKVKEYAGLEARFKELAEALGKISGITTAGKTG